MKPEDKQLLLKDICARLPYNVYVEVKNAFDDVFTWKLDAYTLQEMRKLKSIKPYLRPMSSMTEEEQKEYHKTFRPEVYGNGFIYVESFRSFDWLNEHHFDYRGLIEKDLAISTEVFNPYKD